MKQLRVLWSAILLAVPPFSAVAQQSGSSNLRPSPPLEVQTLDGKVLKIQSLKGKVVLLDFMTTTCPTCKMASAALQTLYLELGPKGFHPVVIALDVESPARLKAYGQEYGLTLPRGTTPRADVGVYLQHPPDKPFMVPTLVMLDRKGRIHSVDVGWKGIEHFRAVIVKLLAR